jgi:DNA-binding NtrC family response regulator
LEALEMLAFLIVDGDRNFGEALAIALRLDGHLAIETRDTDEACERLRAIRFDCCVVDTLLAGADSLLEVISGAGIRAIATSTHEDLLEAAARRHPHAQALPKPFGAGDLVARAEHHASAA